MDEEQGGRRRGRKPGSRPGESASRDAILDAALRVFSAKGYDGASVRSIAAVADVDPALIRHYFGDKANLLVEAVTMRTSLPSRIAEMYEGLGATGDCGRMVDAYFAIWEDAGIRPALIALVRAVVGSPEALSRLRGFLLSESLPRAVRAGMSGSKVVMVMGQLFGVAAARYVAEIPQIANMSRPELVAMLTPGIQATLDSE